MAEAIHADAWYPAMQTRPVRKRPAWKGALRVFPPYGAARSSPVVGWMAEAIHASAASGQTDEAYP